MRPLVLCAEEGDAAAALERLRDEGGSIRPGWHLPWRDWDVSAARIVCTGRIATAEDAQAALLAAARGAGVVAVAACGPRLLERFFEDLQRFGPVELQSVRPASGPPDRLGGEERRLLELLAAGLTLGEAARRLHISRRTADRRLAAARAALDVRTTAEAVVALGRESGGTVRRVA